MARTKKNKELNLLTALDRNRQSRKAGRGTIAMVAVIAVIAVGVGLFFMHMIDESEELTARRDAALLYVEDPGTIALYNESVANRQAVGGMVARSGILTAAVDSITSYPDMSSDDFKTLFSIAGKRTDISNFVYERSTGTLTFDAKCRNVNHVAEFIAALRSSGVFASVYYGGYSGGEYMVAGEGDAENKMVTEYNFQVSCVVGADVQPDAEAGQDIEQGDQDNAQVDGQIDGQSGEQDGAE
jgi:hypothetical protein